VLSVAGSVTVHSRRLITQKLPLRQGRNVLTNLVERLGQPIPAQVHIDAVNAKTLLRPGGVVVFDDYRSEHTPGVSAAVWQAIISDGLIPIALTPAKLYGVYDDPQPYHDALHHRFSEDSRCRFRIEDILDRQVLHARPAPRPTSPKPPPPPPPAIDLDALSVQVADGAAQLLIQRLSEPIVAAAPKPVRVPDVAPATSLGRLRRSVARSLAPPALTRWALARTRTSPVERAPVAGRRWSEPGQRAHRMLVLALLERCPRRGQRSVGPGGADELEVACGGVPVTKR